MRSFRDSIARPFRSLCTLRADVTADYATLASGWRLPLAGTPFQVSGFMQSISLPLHLLRLRSFHGAIRADPEDSCAAYRRRYRSNRDPRNGDLIRKV